MKKIFAIILLAIGWVAVLLHPILVVLNITIGRLPVIKQMLYPIGRFNRLIIIWCSHTAERLWV